MRIFIVVAATAIAWVPTSAAAQTVRAREFQKLVDCRGISDATGRLACFDREVAGLAAAEARQDVVVIDRARVRSARRSLFGLSVPDLGIFGSNDPQEEGVSRIESTIRIASQASDGKWLFRLQDGARWAQTDTARASFDARPGYSIVIRKAAMGSFLANINKQTAIRVKRVN